MSESTEVQGLTLCFLLVSYQQSRKSQLVVKHKLELLSLQPPPTNGFSQTKRWLFVGKELLLECLQSLGWTTLKGGPKKHRKMAGFNSFLQLLFWACFCLFSNLYLILNTTHRWRKDLKHDIIKHHYNFVWCWKSIRHIFKSLLVEDVAHGCDQGRGTETVIKEKEKEHWERSEADVDC